MNSSYIMRNACTQSHDDDDFRFLFLSLSLNVFIMRANL
jgi:hypothetical protein